MNSNLPGRDNGTLAIFDTSVSSENLGDFLIMEAVNRHLNEIFPAALKLRVPTHEKLTEPSYRLLEATDYRIVGGTNLLSSRMNRYHQWNIGILDAWHLDNILLMGVGWWQYQDDPNIYTKYLLKSILHGRLLHSVRDSYTEQKLRDMGMSNVINTSCPTMWELTGEHCGEIPSRQAKNVVCTVTDYRKNREQDARWLERVGQCYEKVYIWPQGSGDRAYLRELELSEDTEILDPTIRAFDRLLASEELSLDYVGTRLHAGIRALQHRRRTIILGVDNRAREMAKDVNLEVVSRDDVRMLENRIREKWDTRITLPLEEITTWKTQFH